MYKSILIVCKANYCRSPVAEKIIKSLVSGPVEIDSAGIIDFFETRMDPRSQGFLESIHLTNQVHIPKRITKDIASKYEHILAMDIAVILELNRKFPQFSDKLSLFSSIKNSSSIQDPFKLKDEDAYHSIMKQVQEISIAWSKILESR